MKVCHVISGDLWAGAEVMAYRLLKGLLQYKELELSAILLNEGKLTNEIRKLGILVSVVDETRLNFLQITRNIQKIVIQTSPDLIHSHRQKENILAYLATRNVGREIALISTQHGLPEPLRMMYKVVKNIIISKFNIHILSTCFRDVVAVSEDVGNALQRCHGIPKSKIKIIHNGTEIHSNNLITEEKNQYVIGSAGRFFPIKDFPFMVAIAREVLKKSDKIRFELAGEGPEREKIIGLIQEYRIEQAFILRGFIDCMTSFYQGLDLYINTSVHEGLPMSILEAMAHGLPVVAPNAGGLKEIMEDGQHGFLVDERDPKLFAEKCLQLYGDRDLRRKMSVASRDRVKEEFSVEAMAEKYIGLYLGMR